MWKLTTTYLLLAIVLILIALGLVILYSTSGLPGVSETDDPAFYLKRQLLWIGIGFAAFVVAGSVDYRLYRHPAITLALAAFTCILLVMVVLPEIGHRAGGSHRWLRFGVIRFQPSELAKLSCIIVISWWMAWMQREVHTFKYGLAIPLGIIVLFAGLVGIEPDYGTAFLITAVGMAILFVGGTRIGYLLVAGLAGACAFALLIAQDEERRNRILAFLDPERYAQGEAFQLVHALYAFVSGGATGVGLGESIQKRHYLPEAHTDFIFAILGEELGFRFTLGVVVLYFALFLCGLRISLKTQDRFGKLLSFGLVTLISGQAALNIGVVTGSLPTKGITLPFISFGGSSMVMSLAMIGILVNIARHMPDDPHQAERDVVKDRAQQL